MRLFQQLMHRAICIIALIMVISISGCSGITPDGKLRNDREEGPESGIFSGPGGEFVIVAPTSEVTNKKAKDKEAVKSQQ